MTGRQRNKIQQVQHILNGIVENKEIDAINLPCPETVERLSDKALLQLFPLFWCAKELEEVLVPRYDVKPHAKKEK